MTIITQEESSQGRDDYVPMQTEIRYDGEETCTCSTILWRRTWSRSRILMAKTSPDWTFLAILTLAKLPSPIVFPSSYLPTRVLVPTTPLSFLLILRPSPAPSNLRPAPDAQESPTMMTRNNRWTPRRTAPGPDTPETELTDLNFLFSCYFFFIFKFYSSCLWYQQFKNKLPKKLALIILIDFFPKLLPY